MHTTIERKPDPVREAMAQHRAIIAEYERQAAGLDEDETERVQREAMAVAFGFCLGAVLTALMWILGLFLMHWVRA